MIDAEIQQLLNRKQDKIPLGTPVPQEGALGDLRLNVTHKGKFYQMMKAGESEWRYSAAFTRTPIDYLPLTGGRITGSLGLPNVKLGVDNTVLIRDTAGNVKTDEIDSRVWGSSLVDGSGAANHIAYWTDGNTIAHDANQLYWAASNNRLGIGTASPGKNVEIYGTSSILRLRDSGATADATLAYIEFGGTDAAAWSRTGFIGDASSGDADIYLQAEVGDLHLGDSSSLTVLNLQGGKVGIGTTVIPHGGIGYAKFAIEGANANAAGPHVQFTTATDDYPLLQLLNWQHGNVYLNFDSYYDGSWRSSSAGSSFSIAKENNKFHIWYDVAAAGAVVNWNEGIVLDANGDVGIGTASPSTPLHVLTSGAEPARFTSTGVVSQIGLDPSVGTSGYISATASKIVIGNINVDSTLNINHFLATGNLSLGLTTDTGIKLNVTKSGAGIVSMFKIENRQAAAADLGSNILIGGVGSINQAEIRAAWDGAATTDAYLAFLTRGSNSLSEKMRITSAGNVGINITTPQEKLAIAGNIVLPKTSGNGIKVDNTTPTFGWRDLLGDQFAKNTGGTKPTLTVYNGDVDAWQFSGGDEAFLTYHIPHDYVPGTDIYLHVHWSLNAVATGGTLDFKYYAIYAKGHNQASGSAFTSTPITALFSSVDINDGGSGLARYQQHLTEVIISAASATAALFDRDDFEPDGVIELTLEMAFDNLTGTPSSPFIHYVDLHYQSTNIGTKDKVPDFYA